MYISFTYILSPTNVFVPKNTRLADNPYGDWIEMYGGGEYQETAAEAGAFLQKIGESDAKLVVGGQGS